MRVLAQLLDLGHRATYRLTAMFSRAGIDRFVDAQLEALSGAKVLNVGSDGKLAERLRRAARVDVVHLDIDPARAPDVVGDVCDMSMFDEGVFDAVFLLEVLEHIEEPPRALDEVFRVLRPGGRVVITTPFLFEIHDAPNDFYRFTAHGLRWLLRAYRHVEVRSRNGYLDTVVVLLMRLYMSPHLSDKIVALALIPWLTASYPLVYGLGKAVRSEAATSGYLVTAIKP